MDKDKNKQLEKIMKNLLKLKPELEDKLDGMISEKIKEYEKVSGKGIIDEFDATLLIAQEYKIPTDPKGPLFKFQTDLEIYLEARNEAKNYSEVVWERLKIKISELTEQIKEHDKNIHKKLYEDGGLNDLEDRMESIFTFNKYSLLEGEPENEDELYREEKRILVETPADFVVIFNKIYRSFIPGHIFRGREFTKGFFNIHRKFQSENSKIRYKGVNDNDNPYFTTGSKHWSETSTATQEFLEYHRGALEYLASTRNYSQHRQDGDAREKFDLADRKISDPFTKIEHPGNYIMLVNLSISCVYEIIELMQIWIDSNKIGKKNSSK